MNVVMPHPFAGGGEHAAAIARPRFGQLLLHPCLVAGGLLGPHTLRLRVLTQQTPQHHAQFRLRQAPICQFRQMGIMRMPGREHRVLLPELGRLTDSAHMPAILPVPGLARHGGLRRLCG